LSMAGTRSQSSPELNQVINTTSRGFLQRHPPQPVIRAEANRAKQLFSAELRRDLRRLATQFRRRSGSSLLHKPNARMLRLARPGWADDEIRFGCGERPEALGGDLASGRFER
jgi:hypothetical protein